MYPAGQYCLQPRTGLPHCCQSSMRECTKAARECLYHILPRAFVSLDGLTMACAYRHQSAITMSSAPTSLDEGVPSATNHAVVNTFDPDGGSWPEESNLASSVLVLLPNQQTNSSAGPLPRLTSVKDSRHSWQRWQ